jgi:hypothetical protein
VLEAWSNDCTDAELIPYQPDIRPVATTIDAPFTCSMKSLHLSIHAAKMLVTMLLHECVEIQEARGRTQSAG